MSQQAPGTVIIVLPIFDSVLRPVPGTEVPSQCFISINPSNSPARQFSFTHLFSKYLSNRTTFQALIRHWRSIREPNSQNSLPLQSHQYPDFLCENAGAETFSAFLSPHSEWNPSACFVYWPCSLLYLVCPVAAALGSQDPAHQPPAQAGSMSPIPWGFVLGTRESTESVYGGH